MKATKEDYKSVIFSGCSIEYKGVSLCNLANNSPRLAQSNEYQVWSNKHETYKLYKNIDEAVDKFIELMETK